jgi:hypothetical protein
VEAAKVVGYLKTRKKDSFVFLKKYFIVAKVAIIHRKMRKRHDDHPQENLAKSGY